MADLRGAIQDAGSPHAGPDLFIALDIDGTVLRHNNTLSPRVGEALQAHIAAGTHLCLATGRGIYGTKEAVEKAGLNEGIVVCSNGAITIDLRDDSVIDLKTFNPSREIAILADVLPHGIFAVESLHEPRRLTANFPDGELTGPSVILPLEKLAIPNATRLTVRHLGMNPHELATIVHEAGLPGVEYAIGWTAWLDVSPRGVSKAAALEDVRASFGIASECTIAAGDGGNDLDMLRWAHLGVAMGSAPDSVKAAADAVTAGVDADGLALLLEELL